MMRLRYARTLVVWAWLLMLSVSVLSRTLPGQANIAVVAGDRSALGLNAGGPQTQQVLDRFSVSPAIGTSGISTPAALSRESLAALRETFLRYGRRSKRGVAGVSMTLQVLDALSAPTATEYHQRIRALPIRIVRKTLSDNGSQMVVEFLVRGTLKSRVFPVLSTAGKTGSPSDDITLDTDGLSGPNVTEQHTVVECEYTDAENVYFSGPCATQQEVDDGYATMIALQEEVGGIEAEVGAACNNKREACEEPTENELDSETPLEAYRGSGAPFANALDGASEMAGSDMYNSDTFNSFSASVGYDSCARTPVTPLLDDSNRLNCWAQIIGYVGALAAFGIRIGMLSSALGVVTPASAIGYSIGLAVIAAGAVAGTAIALHECIGDT